MENPNGINLIEGEWYLCNTVNLQAYTKEKVVVERAFKYTTDNEDAYYKSHLFGKTSSVTIICALRKHYD